MTQSSYEGGGMVDTSAGFEVHIEPALLVADRIAGSCVAEDDGYAAACALSQVWADLLLVAEGSGQSLSVRRRVRVGAARAARAAFDVARGFPAPPAGSAGAGVTLAGDLGPWLETLERALTVPMPECYGYNLGDTEVCVDDAIHFTRELAQGRPVVIVGIRGGGSFLAPRWATGLARETSASPMWTTVRPLGAPSRRLGYHRVELNFVRRTCEARPIRPEIVIVDDQPDTGSTVEQLAQTLAPLASRLWFACIGRIHQLRAPGDWSLARAQPPLRPRSNAPLWQLLLQEDRPRFLATLANALPEAASEAARVIVRCPTLERRYGRENSWLPWNHPALGKQGRQLANPGKTPLLVTGADGTPLLHMRFVGEGTFGQAEFRRVQRSSATSGEAWFLDGYRVVSHLHALRPLFEVLANASPTEVTVWIVKAIDILRSSASLPIATVLGCAGEIRIGERICKTLEILQRRIGGVLPEPPVWLRKLSVPVFGGSCLPVRSALSHAFGYWHWQVGADGTLHRFHIESNWGGLSWHELEIAAFLLEHRQGPEALRIMIASGVVDATQWQAVIASLPVALQLWLQGCLRELRQLSPTGAALWREDLSTLWATLARYSDFVNYPRVKV